MHWETKHARDLLLWQWSGARLATSPPSAAAATRCLLIDGDALREMRH